LATAVPNSEHHTLKIRMLRNIIETPVCQKNDL